MDGDEAFQYTPVLSISTAKGFSGQTIPMPHFTNGHCFTVRTKTSETVVKVGNLTYME
jgi:hypothetical protein